MSKVVEYGFNHQTRTSHPSIESGTITNPNLLSQPLIHAANSGWKARLWELVHDPHTGISSLQMTQRVLIENYPSGAHLFSLPEEPDVIQLGNVVKTELNQTGGLFQSPSRFANELIGVFPVHKLGILHCVGYASVS